MRCPKDSWDRFLAKMLAKLLLETLQLISCFESTHFFYFTFDFSEVVVINVKCVIQSINLLDGGILGYVLWATFATTYMI